MGIEPTYLAWKASVLPLNYTRILCSGAVPVHEGMKLIVVDITAIYDVKSARRGSNPRPPPWQGGAPPLSHSRIYVKQSVK